MTLLALIIIAIILALVLLYGTRPLFTSRLETEEIPTENKTALKQAEYHALLERIRELDFDFNLGKLSPQEHEEQRAELMNQAAICLREIHAEDAPQLPPVG